MRHATFSIKALKRLPQFLSSITRTYHGFPRTPLLVALILIILLGPLLYFSLMRPSPTQAAWYHGNWNYRKLITIDAEVVSGSSDLTDFPFLVTLTSDSDLAANAQSDGDDIVFTDINGNKLDHEIESYDTGTLVAWVRIPTLDHDDDTLIYLYYGNPGASSQENAEGVWDANYNMVHHLSETSGTHVDSTSNNNDSTSISVTAQGTAGFIGGADQFTQANEDGIIIADSSTLDIGTGNGTWQAWVNPTDAGRVMAHTDDETSTDGWDMSVLNNEIVFTANNQTHSHTQVTVGDVWHHLVVVKNGTNYTWYVNGQQQTSEDNSAHINDSDSTLKIGSATLGWGGYLDELRISNTNRSGDWIATEFENQNEPETYISTDTPETYVPGAVSLHLTFNEGHGTTAHDTTGNNNDGSISGANWIDHLQCISSYCLEFDGTDDVVTVTNTSSIRLDRDLASGFTISTWTRANSDGESDNGQLFSKNTGTYARITNQGTDGLADLEVSLDLATTDATVTITDSITLNTWQHITIGYTDDGDDEITVYIDGVPRAASTNGVGSPAADASDLLIGGSTDANFHGWIDEFKIYNQELTASQIAADFAARGSTYGVSAQLGNDSIGQTLTNGLLGYWKLDTLSGSAIDSSGNKIDLSNINTVSFTGGKFGNAASLSRSSSQYFHNGPIEPDISRVQSKVTGQASNPTATFDTPPTEGNLLVAYAFSRSGTSASSHSISGTGWTKRIQRDTELDNTVRRRSMSVWTKVADNSEPSAIQVTGDTVKLSIQEFSTTSSNWTFEESADNDNSTTEGANTIATGTTNSLGEGYHLLLSFLGSREGSSGPTTSSVAWSNDIADSVFSGGVENQSTIDVAYGTDTTSGTKTSTATLNTSGNNTGLSAGIIVFSTDEEPGPQLPEIDEDLTLSAWINPTTTTATTQYNIVGQWDTEAEEFLLSQYGDEIRMYINGSANYVTTTNANLSTNTWYHILGTYNAKNTTVKIFVNGVEQTTSTTGTIPTSISNSGGLFHIGAANAAETADNFYDGLVDDIRLYKRELTATEANLLFNQSTAPIAYYSFNENSGTSTVFDQSVYGNDLTMTNLASSAWTQGKFGSALKFDGTNDYLTRTYDSSFDFGTGSFSIGGWVKKPQQPAANVGGDNTILQFVGFEGGDLPASDTSGTIDLYNIVSNTSLDYFEIQSSVKRSGEYALQSIESCDLDDDEFIEIASPDHTLYNRSTVTWVTFYLWPPETTGEDEIIAQINRGSFNFGTIELTWGSGNTVKLRSADQAASNEVAITPNVWNKIEIKHDTAGNLTTLYVNDGTGVTATPTSLNTTKNFQQISFKDGECGGHEYAVDDVVISTDRLTYDPAILRMDPEGDGNSTDWDATNGYQEVDEIPADDDTSYITSSTATNKQLVNLESPTAAGIDGNIKAIKPQALVRDEGGSSDLATIIRIGETDYDQGEDIDPGATYNSIGSVIAENPDTTDGWTMADLDELQVGVINNASVASRATSITNMVLTDSSVSNRYIASRYDNDQGFKLWFDQNGAINFAIDDDADWNTEDIVTSSPDLDDNQWHYLTAIKDGTSAIHLYIDGVLVDSDTSLSATGSLTSNSAPFTLGSNEPNNGGYFDGLLDEFKIYNSIRTPSQIIEDMNGGHPIGGSPVGSQLVYWKMNEMSGDYAYDYRKNSDLWLSGGTTCPGASTCPQWTPNGKFGGALSFDGGDYAEADPIPAYDNNGSDPYTATLWFKSNTAPSTYNYGLMGVITGLVDLIAAQDRFIQVTATGLPRFYVYDGAEKYATGTTVVTDDQWHHLAGVFDGSHIYLYVDGHLEATTAVNGSQDHSSDLYETYIRLSPEISNYYEPVVGTIDEVKIYTTALTPQQILADINQGSSATFGATSTTAIGRADNSKAREYCVPGDTSTCSAPYVEYLFENLDTSTVYDTSGNSRNGTINGSATGGNGRFGRGMGFDGTDDSISISDIGNNELDNGDLTLSAWINVDSYAADEGAIVARWNDDFDKWAFRVETDGSLGFIIDNDESGCDGGVISNICEKRTAAGTITTGQWYHVAAVYNDTDEDVEFYVNGVLTPKSQYDESLLDGLHTNDDLITLGRRQDNNDEFNGLMDQVRIYDYARTPAQIAWEYNRGAPVLWYKFDECSGSTINDWAPAAKRSVYRGQSATLIIGETGTNTSIGSCNSGTTSESWHNGTNGKFNNALHLDGTDDYTTTPDPADGSLDFADGENFTLAFWANIPDRAAADTIIAKKTSNNATNPGYMLHIFEDETIGLFTADGIDQNRATSAIPLPTDKWTHVTFVYIDDTRVDIYFDGKKINTLDGQDPLSSIDSLSNAAQFRVGAESGTAELFLQGMIDDVKVYRYALTPQQIRDTMHNGAASFR